MIGEKMDDTPEGTMQDDGDLHSVQVEAIGPMFPDGPFKVTMHFGVRTETEEDGDYQEGFAECELPPGRIPTDEDIGKFAVHVLGALPLGFRFMTRQEFASKMFRDRTGIDIGVSVPDPQVEFRLDAFKA